MIYIENAMVTTAKSAVYSGNAGSEAAVLPTDSKINSEYIGGAEGIRGFEAPGRRKMPKSVAQVLRWGGVSDRSPAAVMREGLASPVRYAI